MSKLSARNTDGRINLEQQRKRAKELLRRLKAGSEPEKCALLRRLNPSDSVSLADAQWLIAKELGFSNWPKLKAHVESIDFAARHPNFAADDEASATHWRCGNDIEHSLRVAGFRGNFRVMTDPLCMAPVQDLPYEKYRTLRSRFISQAFQMEMADVVRRFDEEYIHLPTLDTTPHAVLWCEADPYDQLFLIRLLASIKNLPRKLELIEVAQVPGVERFIGIGQLSPDVLAWLWPQRRPIGEDALKLAQQAWLALCSGSPVNLAQIAHSQHASLPFLAPALLRQLQELPDIRHGLSLTERLSLQYIAEAGPVTCGRVFAELTAKREPLPHLGDLMFYAALRPLIDAENPLITESETDLERPYRSLTLTPLGHQILHGQAYWLDYASQERWIGGVGVKPRQPHWAISEECYPVWRG
ncbi:DUF1835 domain-containing protein [Serratia aquatilis]|uniref:DUF1835 domain-containing protein n=1 Tax=Serratia aquatilis TaxID=1737515 RepID=A0ABV6EH29_9GAMM